MHAPLMALAYCILVVGVVISNAITIVFFRWIHYLWTGLSSILQQIILSLREDKGGMVLVETESSKHLLTVGGLGSDSVFAHHHFQCTATSSNNVRTNEQNLFNLSNRKYMSRELYFTGACMPFKISCLTFFDSLLVTLVYSVIKTDC